MTGKRPRLSAIALVMETNSWNEIEEDFRVIFQHSAYCLQTLQLEDGKEVGCVCDFHRIRSFLKETAHKEYLRGRREATKSFLKEMPKDVQNPQTQYGLGWNDYEKAMTNVLQAALEEKGSHESY